MEDFKNLLTARKENKYNAMGIKDIEFVKALLESQVERGFMFVARP